MKTAFTTVLALAAAASLPAFADRASDAKFSYNPNDSVAEIYVDLAETATAICEAEFKNSAVRSVYGTAIVTCERTLLDQVVAQIGDPSLASLHDGGPEAGKSLAEIRETN